MKKVLRKEMLIGWIKFTLAVLVLFIINTIAVISAYAGEKSFSVKDIQGRQVLKNEENEYMATSDITFEFKGIEEPETEEERERDWIFCEKECIENRDIYTPVKNDAFRLDVNGDMEISFLWIDRISGETATAGGIPGNFVIRYMDAENLECNVDISAESKGRSDCLSGREPVITIDPPEYVYTFFSVKKDNEEEIFELTGGHNEFNFREGEYDLKLWSEDGWGVKTIYDMDPDSFIYDKTPPETGNINVRPSDRNVFTKDGRIYTSKSVLVIPDAKDSGSGIDHFIFNVFNRTDKSEYEAYGDELQIDPGFNGTVAVSAVDRSGNVSNKRTGPEIIIDDQCPVLQDKVVEKNGKGDKKIKIKLTAGDSLSGIKKITLFLNGEMVNERELKGDNTGSIETVLDLSDLKEGKNVFRMEAFDMTGNKGISEFSLNKEDDRKPEKDTGEKEEQPEDREYTVPEMYLKGFRNFQKTDKDVKIEAGSENYFPEEGKVIIERHGMDGELMETYEAEPGTINVSDEGNYAVHYEIDCESGKYERYGYFTIDRSSPVIKSLKEIDKKTFSSFALGQDPLSFIEDLTYVNGHVTLSGREYDGGEVTIPGKYVLKIAATDELGHSSEESAEFIISGKEEDRASSVSGNAGHNILKDHTLSGNVLSGNSLSENSVSGQYMVEKIKNNAYPGSKAVEKSINNNETTIIPLIIICALLLCAAGTVILIHADPVRLYRISFKGFKPLKARREVDRRRNAHHKDDEHGAQG